MSNYSSLKATINANIRTNGNQEITGSVLNSVLNAMVTSLGVGYLYVGVARTDTNPGTPDSNVFYIAGEGTYPHFNSATIAPGYLGLLKFNGSWSVESVLIGKDYDDEINTLFGVLGEIAEWSISPSPNIFNKERISPDTAVERNSGTLYSLEGTTATDYMEIPSGASQIYTSALRVYGISGWACYNANKVFTHGGSTQNITLQSGDVYLRLCMLSTSVDTAMVIVGTAADMPGEYVPYGDIITATIKNGKVVTASIQDGAVTSAKLADGAISKDKVDFIIATLHKSSNLLNPATCVFGYINLNTGALNTSITTRYATDFIPVDSDGLTASGWTSYGSVGGWAVYNQNKYYIRGGLSFGNYAYQPGDAFVRLTMLTTGLGSTSYVVKSTDPHAYTPYFDPYYTYSLDPSIALADGTIVPAYEPARSLAGLDGEAGTNTTLSNATISLSDYPQYIKRCFNLTAGGKISSFNQLDMGVGKDTQNGTFLRVDSTNIYLCRYYQGSVTIAQTQAHGLTIGGYITLSAYMKDGVMTAKISTLNGSFSHTFNALGAVDSYGIPFCTASSSTSITGFTFRAAGVRFRNPVWVIGDSYVSWYPQRWTYQLAQTGITDYLLDGLAGGNSNAMYAELVKLLKFGTPKFLVWCLGMNDTFALWQENLNKLTTLCASKGITLILQTIPWPQGGSKADINNAVRSSGYRYIDVYAAVSSDNQGAWYAGYSDDGTHTSVQGAIAQANRFILDFPEIFQ